MATSKQRRPADHEYWCAAWSRTLFAGDIFQAVPFHTPPTEIYEDEYTQEQHYFAQLGWGYGLLISPTCDMYESVDPERIAHPFRTVVPILPLAEVTERTRAVAESVGLLRSRDQLTAYMYLPPLAEFFGESVACLYRPTVVTDDFLADPPRRIAQMQPEARRHLKVKLARYWARAAIDPDDLELRERGEDEAASQMRPPSRFDCPQRFGEGSAE
jgi:hypothetical protein